VPQQRIRNTDEILDAGSSKGTEESGAVEHVTGTARQRPGPLG
jgi:hypothetical protein